MHDDPWILPLSIVSRCRTFDDGSRTRRMATLEPCGRMSWLSAKHRTCYGPYARQSARRGAVPGVPKWEIGRDTVGSTNRAAAPPLVRRKPRIRIASLGRPRRQNRSARGDCGANISLYTQYQGPMKRHANYTASEVSRAHGTPDATPQLSCSSFQGTSRLCRRGCASWDGIA